LSAHFSTTPKKRQNSKIMRVLIADDFEQSGIAALKALGCEVLQTKLKEQALADFTRQEKAEVLIVRSTQVSKAVLEAPDLALVVRAGAGVNTIDITAASNNGVYVANCPGKNAFAVAELAIGLLVSVDRRIPENVTSLKNGEIECLL
jgi:D-3-phosphoglycerate dehydrogenase